MAVNNDPKHITLKAAADYSAKQYFLVKQTASDTATLAGAGEDVIGVIANKPRSGELASVQSISGSLTIKVVLGGTVAIGAPLKSDANGKAITATTGNKAFGRAMIAGVAGDIIEVRPGFETV